MFGFSTEIQFEVPVNIVGFASKNDVYIYNALVFWYNFIYLIGKVRLMKHFSHFYISVRYLGLKVVISQFKNSLKALISAKSLGLA